MQSLRRTCSSGEGVISLWVRHGRARSRLWQLPSWFSVRVGVLALEQGFVEGFAWKSAREWVWARAVLCLSGQFLESQSCGQSLIVVRIQRVCLEGTAAVLSGNVSLLVVVMHGRSLFSPLLVMTCFSCTRSLRIFHRKSSYRRMTGSEERHIH